MLVPPSLIALAVLFGVNRLVLPRFLRRPAIFWPLNVVNLATALWVYANGFPGMEDQVAVRLLIGTLLLFHIAQNLALRAREQERIDGEPARRRERLMAARHAFEHPVESTESAADAADDDPDGELDKTSR